MKQLAIILLFFGLSGCGQDASDNSNLVSDIKDWQQRELHATDIKTQSDQIWGTLFNDLVWFSHNYFPNIDEQWTDSWHTSDETLESGIGDCKDMAVLAYRMIIDSYLMDVYPDLDVRMRVVDLPDVKGEIDHVVTVVYHGLETWEFSNMILREESNYPIVVEFDINSFF